MADNKKPKVSFAEQLKAQAGKLKSADPSKETAEVDVGGQVMTVVRGDMSDAIVGKAVELADEG
jgi:hypothetical protein